MATTMAVSILLREEHRHAQSAPAGNDRHFVNRVMLGHQPAHNGMPRLVIGRVPFLGFGHHHGAPLCAHHDLILGQLKLIHTHEAQSTTGSEECGLIHQICQISA